MAFRLKLSIPIAILLHPLAYRGLVWQALVPGGAMVWGMKHRTTTLPISTRALLGLTGATAALLMAGCASNGTATDGTRAPPARQLQVCHAEPVQIYLGHNTVASTLETIRQKSGSYLLRVLREGQPATMDYNQERLNVITNDAGKITALRCG